ncbi:50S ribosomal protein L4 [Candidatus Bathyarchaeota archaeon A05DMB-2]|jgi:large subunit ribosomal protein L4e|nr:50S ribosomal protein L4 [Candidatus Bathyarchaeota archaeon A05DMB-2]
MPQPRTVKVYNLKGKATVKTTLPAAFATPLRPDVIKRAVLAIQSKRRQPQGRDPMAGKRTSAESRGTGMAISRVPRIKGGRGTAAFAPGTVGGRQAHPPKAEKKIAKRLPKKEARLALLSAIAATASKKTVAERGHQIDDVPQFPMVVTDDIQSLTKTKEVEEALLQLGLMLDVYRVRDSRKIRAGKGKHRGRKMKQAVGPLIVIAENRGLAEAASNIPGLDVVTVNNLNTELLAPGTHMGRLTLWTNSAVAQLAKLYGEEA